MAGFVVDRCLVPARGAPYARIIPLTVEWMHMADARDRGITLRRIIDAPPARVYTAWTDPRYLQWYLNPGQHTDHPIEVDLRVGGQWRLEMVESPEKRYLTGGIYRALKPDRQLVFTFGAFGGWPELDGDAADEAPVVTVTLTEHEGATEMTLHMGFADTVSDERVRSWLDLGMEDGWRQTIDRLVPAPA